MERRWNIQKHDYDQVSALAGRLGCAPLVAAMLISRGYSEEIAARRFLAPCVEDLHDPFLLLGMKAAVARIRQAVERDERILVWGDYDVDGTTGTVLLRKALTVLGARSSFHIPNRFTEGYGVNVEYLKEAKEQGVTLAITVD